LFHSLKRTIIKILTVSHARQQDSVQFGKL
jgi:hypothetical protein